MKYKNIISLTLILSIIISYISILPIEANAETNNYVVVPIKDKSLLGCVATVYDKKTKKRIYAIVADCGPNKYNEVSLKAAWSLGYYDATGNNGPEGKFEIIIWRNSAINWKYKNLQKQIDEYGKKYYNNYVYYK